VPTSGIIFIANFVKIGPFAQKFKGNKHIKHFNNLNLLSLKRERRLNILKKVNINHIMRSSSLRYH